MNEWINNVCGLMSQLIRRVKHTVIHIYWMEGNDGRCWEAGVRLLTGRFPCVFLTLGSFPCWHSPAAYRSPLWDDSCSTQTCTGHALKRNYRPYFLCWSNKCIALCIFFHFFTAFWNNVPVDAINEETRLRDYFVMFNVKFTRKVILLVI